MLLRTTWLDPTRLSSELSHKVKVVFFVGSSVDSTMQDFVSYENEVYGDVVQMDFIDSYQNNTYKAMSYLW